MYDARLLVKEYKAARKLTDTQEVAIWQLLNFNYTLFKLWTF
jgi:hypothetical protein